MSYFAFPGMGDTLSWDVLGCHGVERTLKDVNLSTDIIRDCYKCVYEVGCHGDPVGCKRYKRDAPDGGYYG